MAFPRPERLGDGAEGRAGRARGRARRIGRPVRIGTFDVDQTAPSASSDRVVLLRFEWRTSRDEVQPVLLALPELLD